LARDDAGKTELKQDVVDVFTALRYKVACDVSVEGKSGVHHSVDMVAEKPYPSGSGSRVILVECKSRGWDPALRMDEVIVFWGKIFDIGKEGVIVTTCRVSENSRRFAEYYKIPVVEGDRSALKKTLMYGYV